MANHQCLSCHRAFLVPVIVKSKEVCPICEKENFEWTTEGMKSAEYYKQCYWNLKNKYNGLIDNLERMISGRDARR